MASWPGLIRARSYPLGVGGERLHEWMRELAVWRRHAGLEGGVENASTEVLEQGNDDVGAIIMGRNMFGGGPGPWGDDPWRGWWGDDPPFHVPVFVLTHHPRPPLECFGGTTFTFVTDGPAAALALARAAAGGRGMAVSGGAGVAGQDVAAGLVDEIAIHLAATFLGDGVRIFESPGARGRRAGAGARGRSAGRHAPHLPPGKRRQVTPCVATGRTSERRRSNRSVATMPTPSSVPSRLRTSCAAAP
jgi:dihydrofolate reductase